MPLTPVNITASLLGSLSASGMLGTGASQLAVGIASGVMLWVGQLTVTTVDVGTLGVGAGTFPCVIPQPLLLAAMLSSFPATGHLGSMSLLLATGIANGLATAFPQGLITTVNPTVGVGTATCIFPGPSAVPSMIAGFKSAGMNGAATEKTAMAVGMGLDIAFGSYVQPIPIVGPPSPSPSSGTGTGKIL
jgi:hypothetical protein